MLPRGLNLHMWAMNLGHEVWRSEYVALGVCHHRKTSVSWMKSSNWMGACAGDDGDEKVMRLMALGFARQQCMEVLAACNGNEEHAASLLFEMGGGLGF